MKTFFYLPVSISKWIGQDVEWPICLPGLTIVLMGPMRLYFLLFVLVVTDIALIVNLLNFL